MEKVVNKKLTAIFAAVAESLTSHTRFHTFPALRGEEGIESSR